MSCSAHCCTSTPSVIEISIVTFFTSLSGIAMRYIRAFLLQKEERVLTRTLRKMVTF